MESGSIGSWNLKAGDAFAPGDVFCTVETDKATVDFEAQDEGYVAKILATDKAEMNVGDPILVTVEDESDIAAFKDFTVESAGAAAAPEAAPEAPATAPPPSQTSTAASPAARSAPSSGSRIFASPLARKLAGEMNVPLHSVVGTGPGGRVIAADIQEYQPSAVAVAAESAATPASTTAAVVPVSATGERWADSKRNVPHYYLTVEVSVDKILKMRETFADIGVYEFLIKAAALSMKSVPSVNASWRDSAVRQYESVDINVVTEQGEILLRNCESLGLSNIGTALETETDTTAGTFTMLNLGLYGVQSCAPIIREPQSCALAIGAIATKLVDVDQTSQTFIATLSCDHRVVDGAVGAQWLAAFKNHVENPDTMLL